MRRFRRLRVNPQMRRMVRETKLCPSEFIYPIFVAEGQDIKKPVDSMPGVYQYSIDRLEEILPEIDRYIGHTYSRDTCSQGRNCQRGIQ